MPYMEDRHWLARFSVSGFGAWSKLLPLRFNCEVVELVSGFLETPVPLIGKCTSNHNLDPPHIISVCSSPPHNSIVYRYILGHIRYSQAKGLGVSGFGVEAQVLFSSRSGGTILL